ncbi:TPA: DNA methylase, partial [Escherichia coli]|nr:DNA methylase [Escherichia coli]
MYCTVKEIIREVLDTDVPFAYGADVSIVHDVVRGLMEEKRASR